MRIVKERMKELRMKMGLTQKEFADRIGVKQSTIATYEIGRNNPSDTVIALICREFNIDELWLRTGEGRMFRPVSRDEEIAAFIGDVLRDEPGSFRKGLISALTALTVDDWRVLENLAREAIERARNSSEEDAGRDASEPEPKNETAKKLIPLPPPVQALLPDVKGLDDDDDPKTVLKVIASRDDGKILWALSPKQAAQLDAYLEKQRGDSAADDL